MNRKAVADFLTKFEGNIPHMYRCTGGKVTVGVGRAFESAAEACKFSWRIGNQPAKASDIAGDFLRVSAAELNHPAGFYKKLTTCTMLPEDISTLLDQDISRFEEELKQKLPNWNSYPDEVQRALFDMGYNLGVNGLLGKFPKMLAAVNAHEWETAAKECQRQGIGDARNAATAALFRTARK